MIRFRLARLVLLATLLAAVLIANVVHADALPPGACTRAGETCGTAGPGFDEQGVCLEDTCFNPFKDASVDCLMCKLADAGAVTLCAAGCVAMAGALAAAGGGVAPPPAGGGSSEPPPQAARPSRAASAAMRRLLRARADAQTGRSDR